ncbi:MAG: hypothetical protein AAF512_15190, partial [Pseudomonadota bacterium]
MIPSSLRELLANKPVCVHASMRSFKAQRYQANEIIDTLLGLGCTVVAPTFTYGFEQPAPIHDRPARNGWNYD